MSELSHVMDITRVVDTGKFCFAGVVNTSEEFLRSVIDNSKRFADVLTPAKQKK
jgi:hypothetical protein